jgi:ubiquinone biosynthesis protein UbiJ
MLPAAVLKILNHLIDQTPGAHARLASQAGRHVRLELGTGSGLSFAIEGSGRLVGDPEGTPAVTIRVPADALLRFPHQGESALREARVEGDAALAETISQVFRSLHWDAAEDISRLLGDAAAERLVGAARSTLASGRDLAARLTASTSEYVADEAAMVMRSDAVESFASSVDTLRDDQARLQKRIEQLERSATTATR